MSGTGSFEQPSRHWRFLGVAYFVTWRIMPRIGLLISTERDDVADALKHFHQDRYILYAYVVMDDHVHVLVRPLAHYQLSHIFHSWKSYTANRINRLRAASGALWQADYFDRVIESEREFQEKVSYILNNPRKRWPDARDYTWVGWNSD